MEAGVPTLPRHAPPARRAAAPDSAQRALRPMSRRAGYPASGPSPLAALALDLCQDFGHANSRNQAAIGMASGLGSVLSKKAAMASAGTL